MSTPIFTIEYPEFDVAEKLQKLFPKSKNFSVAIPLSRQQKFYDLLLVNGDSKKIVTIQVKSSRLYKGKNNQKYEFYSWLNWFDISENYSDFYFIYMICPLIDKKAYKARAKWDTKILIFNKEEMQKVLHGIKTKSGNQEKFFSFGFDSRGKEIFGERGFSHWETKDNEFSKNLFKNKIKEIMDKF